MLQEIARTPNLAPYYQDVQDFRLYLQTTERCAFRIYGEGHEDEDFTPYDIERDVEYVHRWTQTYRRAVISKFYQLEDWYNQAPTPLTLMTLTTYHDAFQSGKKAYSSQAEGMTVEKSFDTLKASWNALRDCLRYYLPGTPWVWIMEPHISGYPHLHVVIFSDVTRGTQASIKKLWSEKYQAGSFDRGADFQVRKPDEGIKSLRNYLIKYVCKGFTSTGSKFGEGDAWTAGQVVFYALVKKNGWRLFGASKDLCKIMAYRKNTDENINWYATQLLPDGGEPVTTWLKDGFKVPEPVQEDTTEYDL